MKKFTIAFFSIVICSTFFLNSKADVHLPAVISSHMVLQQNTYVNIWGWSEPGEKIIISPSWDTANYTTSGSPEAKWILKIKTPTAGGPYSLTIKGNNKIVIDDVLIGEVWTCSGQSNMEMSYSWGIKQYTNDIEKSANQSIRLFHVPKLTAAFPQDDLKGYWVVCNPVDLKTFSLAGYFFGQKLHEVLSVPVGLIEASWGGTPAEVWTPKDSVDNNAVLKKAADSLKPSKGWPIKPSVTFNAMISPITNYNIAGAIWYQGESNVGTASTYHQLFSTMIKSWRTAWQTDFPFYFVQIAPFSGYGSGSAALLQEAQTNTLDVPNTGMVVISDLVTDLKDIHPKDKKDVGYRLANLALSQTYGKTNFPYKYPMFKSMHVKRERATIYFTNAKDGLKSKGDTINGFYIAGADKIFLPATAKITGNTVEVWNENIKNPVAVRFGFTNSSIAELFNKEGLPVNLFRTDNWDNVNTIK